MNDKDFMFSMVKHGGVWWLVQFFIAQLLVVGFFGFVTSKFPQPDELYFFYLVIYIVHTLHMVTVSVAIYKLFDILNMRKVFPYLAGLGISGSLLLMFIGLSLNVFSSLGGFFAIFYLIPLISVGAIIYVCQAYYT